MSVILNSIISLFLIMFAGVYGRKKGIISSDVNKGLTNILLDITLPSMIITSFNLTYDDGVKSNVLKTFYYSPAVYIIIAVLSFILMVPVKRDKKLILHFSNIFTNTGYIGFPILNFLYGAEAVMYGSIFNMFFNIFIWTYGIIIFKGKMNRENFIKEMLRALKNPALIAVYIGMAMMIFDIKLPKVLSISLNSIGTMTAPISMIIVGYLSCKINVKKYLKDWTIYYGIMVKLIIIPLLLYFISAAIMDKSIVSSSLIILSSMPAAAMTSIFADRFNIEREYASAIVVTTTIMSIFTLPVLLKMIM